ncbi:MAG: triose-phosphate isomerase [Bacteroidota bacterium]
MRKRIIAGNWKMHMDQEGTRALLADLAARLDAVPPGVEAVVCPPFPSLALAAGLLRGTPIGLGAQNMSPHAEGAYTGEVSWRMLLSAGCSFVILGHSERREIFGETDTEVNAKLHAALEHGLRPILCAGETLGQREKGLTHEIVGAQIRAALEGVSPEAAGRVIVAYEPVWAIGTGRTATPGQAQEVHRFIRTLVAERFGPGIAARMVIQYGGSVKPDNIADLIRQDDIDGALVGGASLNADSFSRIVLGAAP